MSEDLIARRRNPGIQFCLPFLALCLSACGGQSAGTYVGSPSGNLNPRVNISWAERSRSVIGPASALSAKITIAYATGGSESVLVNRNVAPTAYVQNYSFLRGVHAGQVILSVEFWSGPNETASKVGVASTAAVVLSDGTLARADGLPLPDVETVGTIATVSVIPGQEVNLGASKQLSFAASDSNGKLLAVSPGAAFWTPPPPAQITLQVTQDGIATGEGLGDYDVTVSVDGVSSQPQAVKVALGAKTNMILVPQQVSSMVYNPHDGFIYASVPSTAATNANRVVKIDPIAGIVSGSVFSGSNPGQLALSDDGSTLYAGVDGAFSVAEIPLTGSNQPITFPISTPEGNRATVLAMLVPLGSPDTVVVDMANAGPSYGGAPSNAFALTAYDHGIARPNNAVPSNAANGPAPYSLVLGSSNALFASGQLGGVYALGAQGISLSSANANLSSASTIVSGSNRIFTDTGLELDAATGNLLGSIKGIGIPVVNPYGTLAYRFSGTNLIVSGMSNYYQTCSILDSATFAVTKTITFPGQGLYLGVNPRGAVVGFGTNGLAIASSANPYGSNVVILKDATKGLN